MALGIKHSHVYIVWFGINTGLHVNTLKQRVHFSPQRDSFSGLLLRWSLLLKVSLRAAIFHFDLTVKRSWQWDDNNFYFS